MHAVIVKIKIKNDDELSVINNRIASTVCYGIFNSHYVEKCYQNICIILKLKMFWRSHIMIAKRARVATKCQSHYLSDRSFGI